MIAEQCYIKDLTGLLDNQASLIQSLFVVHRGHNGLLFIAQLLLGKYHVGVAILRLNVFVAKTMVNCHRLYLFDTLCVVLGFR